MHIDYVRNKCSKRLNILKFISGIKWRAELFRLISLYKSLICSHIEYRFFVFAPKTKNLMLKLARIQYAALRTALGYRSSTPTNIIFGEFRLCMLQHRVCWSNSESLYNWVNRLHNSTMWSNLVRKSHNILPREIDTLHERQLLKTEKTTPPFYMNTIYSFQQYPLKLNWVISSKMLRTRTPCSLLISVTDPLTSFPFLLMTVRMRCLVE